MLADIDAALERAQEAKSNSDKILAEAKNTLRTLEGRFHMRKFE